MVKISMYTVIYKPRDNEYISDQVVFTRNWPKGIKHKH